MEKQIIKNWEKAKKKYLFRVYSRDCYRLSRIEKVKAFLKGFNNFNEAYNFAKKYGEKTAIH